MINAGMCPSCKKKINNVNLEQMPIHVDMRVHLRGVSFVCPSCHAILGISYDHTSLLEDTTKDILKALGVKKN